MIDIPSRVKQWLWLMHLKIALQDKHHARILQSYTHLCQQPTRRRRISEEEQLEGDAGVYTYDALEHIKMDVKRRKFICKGGKKLSIAQVAENSSLLRYPLGVMNSFPQ